MNEKIQKLAEALKKADQEAKKLSETPDDGSCNFDSPVIRLPRWKESEVKEASELSGVEIGDMLSSKWWRGCRFVSTAKYGQAGRRTVMSEAAYNSLKADGYDVSMYYQMD